MSCILRLTVAGAIGRHVLLTYPIAIGRPVGGGCLTAVGGNGIAAATVRVLRQLPILTSHGIRRRRTEVPPVRGRSQPRLGRRSPGGGLLRRRRRWRRRRRRRLCAGRPTSVVHCALAADNFTRGAATSFGHVFRTLLTRRGNGAARSARAVSISRHDQRPTPLLFDAFFGRKYAFTCNTSYPSIL